MTPLPPSPFERIRHMAADGSEYWSARELAALLGYTDYLDFEPALALAEIVCEQAGHPVADHFIELTVAVLPAGAGEPGTDPEYMADMALSRYAGYLTIQNADPHNPAVALGQSYFALRVQQAERGGAPGLTEDQLRLHLRDQMTGENRALNAAAHSAGIRDPNDFALFHDHGYIGLYGGLRMRDIHKRKGLKSHQRILDHMGSSEMAANLFRVTQTRDKLTREDIRTPEAANEAHLDVAGEVRRALQRMGAPMPEALPVPPKSIQQLEQEAHKRLQHGGQLGMFDEEPRE